MRYVRADLYEALQARMAVVRSWGDAPCLEPLGERPPPSWQGYQRATPTTYYALRLSDEDVQRIAIAVVVGGGRIW